MSRLFFIAFEISYRFNVFFFPPLLSLSRKSNISNRISVNGEKTRLIKKIQWKENLVRKQKSRKWKWKRRIRIWRNVFVQIFEQPLRWRVSKRICSASRSWQSSAIVIIERAVITLWAHLLIEPLNLFFSIIHDTIALNLARVTGETGRDGGRERTPRTRETL